MPIGVGYKNISDVRVGTKPIEVVKCGNTIVWQRAKNVHITHVDAVSRYYGSHSPTPPTGNVVEVIDGVASDVVFNPVATLWVYATSGSGDFNTTAYRSTSPTGPWTQVGSTGVTSGMMPGWYYPVAISDSKWAGPLYYYVQTELGTTPVIKVEFMPLSIVSVGEVLDNFHSYSPGSDIGTQVPWAGKYRGVPVVGGEVNGMWLNPPGGCVISSPDDSMTFTVERSDNPSGPWTEIGRAQQTSGVDVNAGTIRVQFYKNNPTVSPPLPIYLRTIGTYGPSKVVKVNYPSLWISKVNGVPVLPVHDIDYFSPLAPIRENKIFVEENPPTELTFELSHTTPPEPADTSVYRADSTDGPWKGIWIHGSTAAFPGGTPITVPLVYLDNPKSTGTKYYKIEGCDVPTSQIVAVAPLLEFKIVGSSSGSTVQWVPTTWFDFQIAPAITNPTIKLQKKSAGGSWQDVDTLNWTGTVGTSPSTYPNPVRFTPASNAIIDWTVIYRMIITNFTTWDGTPFTDPVYSNEFPITYGYD